MRVTDIETENEQVEFAQEAARVFSVDANLATYGGEIKSGAFLAIRWGLMDRSVLLVRVDKDHEPTVYKDIITGHKPDYKKTPWFANRFLDKTSAKPVIPADVEVFAKEAKKDMTDRAIHWCRNPFDQYNALRVPDSGILSVVDREKGVVYVFNEADL